MEILVPKRLVRFAVADGFRTEIQFGDDLPSGAMEEVSEYWVMPNGDLVPVTDHATARRYFYPPLDAFADAMVKLNSPDPAQSLAGQQQLESYVSQCLAVKAAIPKP